MLKLKQPALVLHAHDVPGYRYKMQYTWTMQRGAGAETVLNWILAAYDALCATNGNDSRLYNVIINCHGVPGGLLAGGAGSPSINIGNIGNFSRLQRCGIRMIWLIACEVASQQGVLTGGVGKIFCAKLAEMVNCDVIASAEVQHVNLFDFYMRGCPWGCIDNFEGLTYRFKPTGQHTYFVSTNYER